MSRQANARKITVKCPRCGGSGNLPQFKHIGGGECFECEGSGRVSAEQVQNDVDAVHAATFRIRSGADIAIEAAARGDFGRADFYLSRVLDDMFSVGTKTARALLAEMRQGVYYGETGRAIKAPKAGAYVANKLIEMGRAR